MSKKFVKRDTPEERELSQKREELPNLQTLFAQRELGLIPLRTTGLRKKKFLQHGRLDAHVLIPLTIVENPLH